MPIMDVRYLAGDEETVRRFAKEALRRGVLIGANGTSLEIAPPLIATRAEIEQMIGRCADAINAVSKEVSA